MTNVHDTEEDLVAAVSITNQWKNSTTTAGAGANANSKGDTMTYVGCDTLAELVWSPQTGLNIMKFAEKKPCFMGEVGPSDHMGFLLSQDTRNEKHISEGRSVASEEVVKSSSRTGRQNRGAAEDATSGVDGSGSSSRPPLEIDPLEKNDFFSDPLRENAQDAISENEKRAEDEERSFYCQQIEEKAEVESHGSIESCKSANLFTNRKRRCSFEQQLILGSKRIKKLPYEYAINKDSSFMNWISNMSKGLKNHKVYDQRIGVCNESKSLESKKFGFQNVFRSLFSPETITQIENKSIISSKGTVLTKNCSDGSLNCVEIKEKETKSVVKHIRLYERVTKEAPKGMFDTIRRLRLSRSDILKWMSSQLSFAHLDGFFLRLRVAKCAEGAGGSQYYVACITGLQGETPWKGLKQPIRVKVGDVECFVESQHVSNCDFLEDELVAWWQKTEENGGVPFVNYLKSKLAERRTLGM